MSRLLPLRSEPDLEDRDPRLVDLDDEDADEVFAALSSATSREILTALHEEPRPASEIASAVDTSVQNVKYHIDKLQDAALIEVVDTWYSETGTEMQVYAPSDEALVLVAGRRPLRSLRQLVERIVGAAAPVAIGAWFAWGRLVPSGGGSSAPPAASQPSENASRAVVVEADVGRAAENGSLTDSMATSSVETIDNETAYANLTGVDQVTTAENVTVVTDGGGGVEPATLAALVVAGAVLAVAGYATVRGLQRVNGRPIRSRFGSLLQSLR